jgi:hypothetical protein
MSKGSKLVAFAEAASFIDKKDAYTIARYSPFIYPFHDCGNLKFL